MKRGKTALSCLVAFVFLSALAHANGLNLNSVGTRALTMGGAFVGLADDFSTLYWNPAGIAQFNTKYFGFYGTDLIPSMTYKLSVPTAMGPFQLVNAKTKTKHYLAGMAAYYHPISQNLVAGIGVYVPSGLGANWDGKDFALIADNNSNLEWSSKIGMVTIAPAIAYKISDMVSIGAALNINYGMFDIKMHAGSTLIPFPPYTLDLGQYEESMKGWGYGATIGILVKPSEMFSIGLTYRTPSTVKFSGDASISNLSLLGYNSTTDVDRDVTWPMWFAAGVALRPMPELIITADIQYTHWSNIDYLETDYKDPVWKVMMAGSGDDKRTMLWNNKTQVRFGAEYKITQAIALRGGYYYDPSPTPDKTMNVLLPNFDFNVFTVGLGYNLNGLQLDFGFEYLMAKERTVGMEHEYAMPGIYNMTLPVPNLSVSYKF